MSILPLTAQAWLIAFATTGPLAVLLQPLLRPRLGISIAAAILLALALASSLPGTETIGLLFVPAMGAVACHAIRRRLESGMVIAIAWAPVVQILVQAEGWSLAVPALAGLALVSRLRRPCPLSLLVAGVVAPTAVVAILLLSGIALRVP
jgi:hypothetical protein